MKGKWSSLVICCAIPLGVGGLSAFLTRQGMELFEKLAKPPLSPPGWVFPLAWTVLYLMMGVASWRIWMCGPYHGKRNQALLLYGVQLAVNFLWPILFFNLGWFLFALLWLILLWVLVFRLYFLFRELDPLAGKLLLPYQVWLTFAAYLNLGIYVLNR